MKAPPNEDNTPLRHHALLVFSKHEIGWNIRCMASGNLHHVIGADDSCISWGHAQYGELGYGSLGPKSSSNPKKIDILEGMHVKSVACGVGLSLIVVDRENIGDRLDKLEVYDGETAEGSVANNVAAVREVKSASKKRKQQEDLSDEHEDGEHDSDNHEDEINGESARTKGKRGGKRSSRGRGKGGKGGKGTTNIAAEAKSSARGRGRPKSDDKGSSGRGRKKAKSR